MLYVAGNHEYYRASQPELLAQFRRKSWEKSGVFFLERRVFECQGVRFLGCTLGSDFELFGAAQAADAMAVAWYRINDYRLTTTHGGRLLTPADTRRAHRLSVRWLERELAKPYAGKTVVITHFVPHRDCVPLQYARDELTPYFTSDLSRLTQKYKIDVWCYGHIHGSHEFVADGCRFISNQRGYPRERSGADFRGDLIIEV